MHMQVIPAKIYKAFENYVNVAGNSYLLLPPNAGVFPAEVCDQLSGLREYLKSATNPSKYALSIIRYRSSEINAQLAGAWLNALEKSAVTDQYCREVFLSNVLHYQRSAADSLYQYLRQPDVESPRILRLSDFTKYLELQLNVIKSNQIAKKDNKHQIDSLRDIVNLYAANFSTEQIMKEIIAACAIFEENCGIAEKTINEICDFEKVPPIVTAWELQRAAYKDKAAPVGRNGAPKLKYL